MLLLPVQNHLFLQHSLYMTIEYLNTLYTRLHLTSKIPTHDKCYIISFWTKLYTNLPNYVFYYLFFYKTTYNVKISYTRIHNILPMPSSNIRLHHHSQQNIIYCITNSYFWQIIPLPLSTTDFILPHQSLHQAT